MNKTELVIFVKSLSQECEVKEGRQFAEATVPASSLHSLAVQLREKEVCSFDFLVSITGVDYGQDLGAVYHLRSTKH
jgi:NADH:ubiquinone oxidoreductase subunit C